MAGGYGDPVTRLDYQVNKAEERLRREQETALGSVLNLISTISNKIDTTDSNIKDLRNEISTEMESLSKAVSTLSTQLTVNYTIFVAILLVVASQVPFLQELTSVFLKFLK